MLIMENDDLIQSLLKRLFSTDFEIDIGESVEEYYEKFSNNIYDIIIMDISLNGKKNGFELTKEMKSLPSYTGTPVICFTAHGLSHTRNTAMELGMDQFILKPVPNKELINAVSILIMGNGVKRLPHN